jgi:hypothetical protein
MIIEYQPENNRAKVIEPTFQHNGKVLSVYLDNFVINSLRTANQLDNIEDLNLLMSIPHEIWEISAPIPVSNIGEQTIASIIFSQRGKLILQNDEITCVL